MIRNDSRPVCYKRRADTFMAIIGSIDKDYRAFDISVSITLTRWDMGLGLATVLDCKLPFPQEDMLKWEIGTTKIQTKKMKS